jgi:hypothetical protein
MGLNLPLGFGGDLQTVPGLDGALDDLFEEDGLFKRSESFKPNAAASQNANFTVKVDMPMLYGVGSFAYTQNFFLNFSTAIGGLSVFNSYIPISETIRETIDDADVVTDVNGFLSLAGGIKIPLAVNLGWETMTFGYAYRFPQVENLVLALNLHRHLFSLDIRAKADIDILGHLKLNAGMNMSNTSTSTSIDVPLIDYDDILIDYTSEICNGSALGRYRASVWTPAVGAKYWRVSYAGRFGINTKAEGSITGRFAIPRIIDLQTGDFSDEYKDLEDALSGDIAGILDKIGADGVTSLVSSAVDSIVYQTTESLVWKMPSGHTLGFDIIPNKLSVSYTKLFGEVAMKLENFKRTTGDAAVGDPNKSGTWDETFDLDYGVSVDHIIMLHANWPAFFVNAGVCSFDMRSGDGDYVLYKNSGGWPAFGKGVMLPVLNGGVTLGTKLQLRVEGDILPLPAVRTGVHYYF